MDKVIWKPVVGYEGLYEVSNTGFIKSLNMYRNKEPHLMSLARRKDGYLKVGLSKNNITKQFVVHRLVAEAFIPNPDNLEIVNHKDEDRSNNNVNNLEWCTRSYNQLYSIELHPERKKVFGDNFKNKDGCCLSSWTKKGKAHKYNKKVALLNNENKVERIFESPAMAAKEMNLDSGNVLTVCKANAFPDRNKQRQIGKKRKTGGHILVFIED